MGVTLTAAFGLLFIYALYPLMTFLLPFKRPISAPIGRPTSATLIITAWQEDGLLKKLENSLDLCRAGIELEIIVMTDELSPQQLPDMVRWVTEPARMGKASSINQAVAMSNNPILVFTDANTRLNEKALENILAPFQYATTGAVAGEKRLLSSNSNEVESERLYWQYESMLKRTDARMHGVIGGAGELFAIRKELFIPLPADCLLDDLELSWQVVHQGYRIAYAPNAIATEYPSLDLRAEARRKIRIAAGAYQYLDRHPLTSLFAAAPLYGWQFLFRKWSRWVLAPILLLVVVAGGAMLAWMKLDTAGLVWCWLQAGFYLLVVAGWILATLRIRIGWLAAPFYFFFMHYCQLRGWVRYRLGQQTAIWEKSARVSI